jgi:hypothetical protein
LQPDSLGEFFKLEALASLEISGNFWVNPILSDARFAVKTNGEHHQTD